MRKLRLALTLQQLVDNVVQTLQNPSKHSGSNWRQLVKFYQRIVRETRLSEERVHVHLERRVLSSHPSLHSGGARSGHSCISKGFTQSTVPLKEHWRTTLGHLGGALQENTLFPVSEADLEKLARGWWEGHTEHTLCDLKWHGMAVSMEA